MSVFEKFTIRTYNIGIIRKGIDNVMLNGVQKGDITWLQHSYHDRFFADPFLINSDDDFYYIICEEFFFFEEKGKITLLTVSKHTFSLISRRVIIEEPYHLSFPYCKFKGTYIIPEASESGKSYKYIINPSTYEVIQKEEILDDGVIDAVIFRQDNLDYLYATKHPNPLSQTLVYKGDGFGHFMLPGKVVVENDIEHARAAGDIFKWKGNIYRAVQDCKGRYGRQTKIMKVVSWGESYEADDVITVNSFENPPYDETMHTFNVYDGVIIVDGSKDFIRFPMKLFYKKAKFLFSSRLKK